MLMTTEDVHLTCLLMGGTCIALATAISQKNEGEEHYVPFL
jgi:hypothetical protein